MNFKAPESGRTKPRNWKKKIYTQMSKIQNEEIFDERDVASDHNTATL